MKQRVIAGAVLAVLSLIALYLWETKYEDRVMLSEVLVASTDIAEGESVDYSQLKIIRITPESKLENALPVEQAELIVGKIASCNIYENQQLCTDYFIGKEELHPDGLFNFVIPSSWIYSKSVLLGERSNVDVFAMPDRMYLGSYRIDLGYDGNLELLAVLSDYFRIYDSVTAAGNKLLLVESGAVGDLIGGPDE